MPNDDPSGLPPEGGGADDPFAGWAEALEEQ